MLMMSYCVLVDVTYPGYKMQQHAPMQTKRYIKRKTITTCPPSLRPLRAASTTQHLQRYHQQQH